MPLFTLNDIPELEKCKGFTIGTTNLMIFELKKLSPDCYFNIDTQKLKIPDKSLKNLIKTTDYESKFIHKLLSVFFIIYFYRKKTIKQQKIYENDWSCMFFQGKPIENFIGGNEFLRKKIGRYFQKFLVNLSIIKIVFKDLKDACEMKDAPSPMKDSSNMHKLKEMCEKLKSESEAMEELKKEQAEEKDKIIGKLLEKYNFKFIQNWQNTVNFRIWNNSHSSTLFCLSKFVDIIMNTTIYYESGDIYSGEICKGKRHGSGTLVFEDGSGIYVGDWKDDKRQGNGNQVTQNGKYTGQFAG